MRIRIQFILTMLLFGIILAIISASVVVTNQRVRQTNAQEEIARNLEREAFELGYLSNDYLLYYESQQLARWESKFASFSNNLQLLRPATPEQQATANSIRSNSQRLRAVFGEVTAALGTVSSQGNAPDTAFVQVSWSRMEVQNQGMIFDASRLSEMLRDQEDQLKRANSTLMSVLIGVFGAFLVANYVLTQRRILRSMAVLSEGTRIIGSGNLDHSIEAKKNDEIGELSRAFNRMTANLKKVTASKEDLEREVLERKRAEEEKARQAAVVGAINRIFQESLTCRTSEDLALFCLKIAEDLTQSKFGFVGELGEDGLLHDTAMSDLGWESCAMYDKDGHRRPPGDFKVHGLYGKVTADGKPMLSNIPQAHPDSVGTPAGHPALKAFLGVPLVHGGKTIGMIGMANRDGGYRIENMEAAEALAPAIVEALLRKRAEELVVRLNEDLKRRAIELEASNKELEAFSYSVSHDLRAPLRSLNGFSQAILEDYAEKLDGQGREYLQNISGASQLMGRLIDDLLNLSRITRADLHQERVHLSGLAHEVASELIEEEPQRQVEFVITPGLESVADRRLLKLVFQNLMGNAFKFTARRPLAIIEFGAVQHNGARAYFVRDNGAGFDMKYAHKLFQPFQRLHSVEEFPGTGIGLASVQRIVIREGGRVWAEGEVDRGATFYFTLREA